MKGFPVAPAPLPEEQSPDYLYWMPIKISQLSSRERPWVGKMVTVTKYQGNFEQVPGHMDQRGDPVHSVKWFGYVKELAKYVPNEELKA